MPVKGGDKLRQLLRQQQQAPEARGVAVGFFATARYPDGTPVTNVAAWNEWGTEASAERPFDIPERPFMRPTVRNEREAVRQMLRARVDGRTMTVTTQDASAIGAYMQGRIQQAITRLRTPPNAPSTVARKGSSNPLLDTGFMRLNVSFEVLR